MPCLSAEELAALYDCVLPRRQSEKFRAHLAECPRCAHEIEVLSCMLECGAKPNQQARPGAVLLERASELARKPIEHSQSDHHRATGLPAGSPGNTRIVPKRK